MIISFELSMPNNNSWNGKWSGEDRFYAKVVNLGRTKKATEKGQEIIDKGYFHYNFGDGWAAGITAKEVDTKQAAAIRKKSVGFCGYEWMIDSIRQNGRIEA